MWDNRERMTLREMGEHLNRDWSAIGYKLRAMIGGHKVTARRAGASTKRRIIEPGSGKPGRKPKRFTLEQDRFIIMNRGILTPSQMGKALGSSRQAVEKRLQILECSPLTSLHSGPFVTEGWRAWTDAEIDFLCDNYGLMPDVEIAAVLGRVRGAVVVKASKMRVRRTDQFFAARHVARILGVGAAVVRRWIKAGYIKASKAQGAWVGTKSQPWVVTVDALDAFLREYPHIYDINKMDREADPDWYRIARKAWENSTKTMNNHVSWSEFEVNYILHNCERMSYAQMGAVLHRSLMAVYHKTKQLRDQGRLPFHKRRYNLNDWTRSEMLVLSAQYGKVPVKVLVEKLGRTERSITMKAGRMGLCRKGSRFGNKREVA